MVTTVAGTPGLVLAGRAGDARDGLERGRAGRAGRRSAYATFLSLLVAYVIWNRSVQVVGPSRTVIYMCLTPLIAVATAAVFLGERPEPLQAVGAALIIGGVLLTRDRRTSLSSSSLATARRRWGITMLPPTTSPTAKISRNSSRVTPFLVAPRHVIGHAVVAPEHQRRDQAEHLLRLAAERARLVGALVEGEEAVDGEIARAEDQLVHPGAESKSSKSWEDISVAWRELARHGSPLFHAHATVARPDSRRPAA